MVINYKKENVLQSEFDLLSTKSKEVVFPKVHDLYLFTVNYKTAPVAIREKFSIPEYSLTEANQNLKKYNSLKSFLLLSTCNRTEIYFRTDNLEISTKEIHDFFTKNSGIEQKITKEYTTIVKENEVIEHAFKLACGLDSLVLGESQVLSQLKSAYSIAQKEQTLDSTLELLFQGAIKCAKEAHKKTSLSKNCQSISSAAIDLANKVCGPLKTKSIMVLGAGKMAKLALEHVIKIGGSKETVVLNRSPHRVIEFSDKYQADRSIPFESVYEGMNDVDIVIAATGAPHFIIFAEQFNQVRKDFDKSLFIFDISMPRNIDSEFSKLPNVKLMDIDSLQIIYSQTTDTNSEDLKLSNEIILEGIKKFYKQIEEKNIIPVIKTLKEKVEKIRTEKLSTIKTNGSTVTLEELDYITKNIVNTIFHKPIKNLKESKLYGSQEEKSQLLKDLFEL
ncbi:MAG: glutamyl-tRNA reductase [Candidatus Melainabacteria bacterium]|nr:glutamyl-tRNA reductase [Candidatus Melainabacteria bacterium]